MTIPRKVTAAPVQALAAIIEHPLSAGIALLLATIAALIVANSPLAESYSAVLHAYVGGLSVGHWINDGLMAVFFLLVGLEMKREMLDGQLSSWASASCPASRRPAASLCRR